MSYLSRLYNHRNAQTAEGKDKPFFSKKEQGSEKNKKNNFFQAKLSVNEPGDKYEHEADNVAKAVVNNKTAKPVVQQKEITSIQRLATSIEDEKLGTNDRRMERDKEDKLKGPIQRSVSPEKEKGKGIQKMNAPGKEEDKHMMQKMEMPEKKKEEGMHAVQKMELPEKKNDMEMPVQKMGADHEKEKVQKKDNHMKEEEKPMVQKMDHEHEKDKVQKKDDNKMEEDMKKGSAVQTKHDASANSASPQVAANLKNTAGKGSKLPAKTMHEMNNSFGADFSNVRVHNDSEAVNMNKELNAQAFTHGRDIYFNEGKFDPNSAQGKFLLAHELTHVVQQGAGQPADEVQRKKIDHRALTWGDFMGKVPKNPGFDAATSSDITDFDSSLYPFKPLTAAASGAIAHVGSKNVNCEKGMDKDKHADMHPDKFKAFTVNIEPSPASILVKSFMWQENSWAKAWTTDLKAREVKAGKDISDCNSTIAKDLRGITAGCKANAAKCRAAFKKNKNIVFTLSGAKATNAGECADLIDPCVNQSKSSISFSIHNQNGVTARASELTDCDTTFKNQMVNTVLEDSSKSLLHHEQRHFDLTNKLAEQLTQELQTKAAGFSIKNVEACTEAAALAAAKKVLPKQRAELAAIVTKFQKKLSALQDTYDKETKHGTIAKAQKWWGENIDKGLAEKSGVGKF
jgi:Domain of unknown function (DUF4157)